MDTSTTNDFRSRTQNAEPAKNSHLCTIDQCSNTVQIWTSGLLYEPEGLATVVTKCLRVYVDDRPGFACDIYGMGTNVPVTVIPTQTLTHMIKTVKI